MDNVIQTIQKFKKVIIVVVVLLVALFAYNVFYLGSKDDDGGSLIRSSNQSVINSEIGREIVGTLNRLKGINIDPEFFEEPTFTRLVDFSVEIQEQPVGKGNPFQENVTIDEDAENLDDELGGSEVFEEVIEETNSDETVN